jgi:type IV pilus assembly protein PilB
MPKKRFGEFLRERGHISPEDLTAALDEQLGEKVVIRLLDPNAPRLRFSALGMTAEACAALSAVLDWPQGMLLATGPTGSGKTTTCYAALKQLRSPSVNIVTAVDPIEYMLEGLNQVQVHKKAGLTFAESLRSILRQDPDIIMVGEIRDAETAEVALKAAQTGHLVLSTVHTSDSVAAIIRLLDLGIPPFLIASSITAILSQRPVRKLCSCRRQAPAAPEYAAQLLASGIEDRESTMFVAGGCSVCDHAGYKGRVAVSEILLFEENVRESIRTEARPGDIRILAQANGMRTIQVGALEKAREGITTFEEVLRIVPFEGLSGLRCSNCSRELGRSF